MPELVRDLELLERVEVGRLVHAQARVGLRELQAPVTLRRVQGQTRLRALRELRKRGSCHGRRCSEGSKREAWRPERCTFRCPGACEFCFAEVAEFDDPNGSDRHDAK